MRSSRVYTALFVVLLCSQALTTSAGLLDDIPVGTGYTAHDLCSRTNVSGDQYERVLEEYIRPKVQPLPYIWSIDAEPGKRVEVQTFVPFLTHKRIALYREGLGCTIVQTEEQATDLLGRDLKQATALPREDAPWPQGEQLAESEQLSAPDAALINRHADAIFAESSTEPTEQRNTTALLVAADGRLVFERYAPGYEREQPQTGWSMTKSLTALVAGLMVTDGAFSLDDPVGLSRWADSEKAKITWRQLLNMSPGLAWYEGYGGQSDATTMLFSQPDQGAWAADLPMESAPGTVFNYSTGTPNIAMLAMKQQLGGTQAIYDFYHNRLFRPLGMQNGVIEHDYSGTPIGGARGLLRPVDWLRLGQLVANKGVWNGEQLIAQPFMDYFVTASPAAEEYGAFTWRKASEKIPAELRQRLPDDLIWFAGHMGQFTVIIPSMDLVVLRMGAAFDEDGALEQTFSLAADLAEQRRSE
ncbi:MAG: hypothetical protein CL583_13955 [Alteromonadaceae bacterium]|nr:hypothetical protein [Alteromonadaceae bacterium]